MNITEKEMHILCALSNHYVSWKKNIETDLSQGALTAILRRLKRKGLVRLESAFDDDGILCGTGYMLTSCGARVSGMFGEDMQKSEIEKLKSIPEPERVTPKMEIFRLKEKVRKLERELEELKR